ncbi:hypothetical protein HYFRA_00006609 [Hymenoscyphus fraxineus]|uniref:Uncharacterized protein n=1 Tax=Hymenoscyphus fraxineus TaxID=746836 RepID=A0A9N9PS23_9HELO|nr:hypothetical protein HYFRA_00006609 [Hymenoscyphus fraxineus]
MMSEDNKSESEWSTLSTPDSTTADSGEVDSIASIRAVTPTPSTDTSVAKANSSHTTTEEPLVKVDISKDGKTCTVVVVQNANVSGFTLNYSPDTTTPEGWVATLSLADENVKQTATAGSSANDKNKPTPRKGEGKKSLGPKWTTRFDACCPSGFVEEFSLNTNEIEGKNRVGKMLKLLNETGKVEVRVNAKRNRWVRFLNNLNLAAIQNIKMVSIIVTSDKLPPAAALLSQRTNPLFKAPIEELSIEIRQSDFQLVAAILLNLLKSNNTTIRKLFIKLLMDAKDEHEFADLVSETVKELNLKKAGKWPKDLWLAAEGKKSLPPVFKLLWKRVV